MSIGGVHTGRVPFRYQLTEHDCAPTSLLNGLSLLLNRSQIPGEVLRTVFTWAIDVPGAGTTTSAESCIMLWIDKLRRAHPSFSVGHSLLGDGFANDAVRAPEEMPEVLPMLKRLTGTKRCVVLKLTDGKKNALEFKYHSVLALKWDHDADMLEVFDPCLKGSFPKGGPQRNPEHGHQEANLKIPAKWLTGTEDTSSATYRLPPTGEQSGILLFTGKSPL